MQKVIITKGLCLNCGKKFVIPKYKPNAKFCSASCRIVGNGKLSAKKRGDVQRGRGLGKSYRKLNGRHEHRVIAEQILGRKLKSNEIVHHKDGNKLNNSKGNLEIMTQAQHARIHSTKNRICERIGCGNKHHSKGLCNKHYRQYLKTEREFI